MVTPELQALATSVADAFLGLPEMSSVDSRKRRDDLAARIASSWRQLIGPAAAADSLPKMVLPDGLLPLHVQALAVVADTFADPRAPIDFESAARTVSVLAAALELLPLADMVGYLRATTSDRAGEAWAARAGVILILHAAACELRGLRARVRDHLPTIYFPDLKPRRLTGAEAKGAAE
jgi:hypothetical protein